MIHRGFNWKHLNPLLSYQTNKGKNMTSLQGQEYVTVISGLTGGKIVATGVEESHDVFMQTYEIVFPGLKSAVCALESFTEPLTDLDRMLKRPKFTGELRGHSHMSLEDEVSIIIQDDFTA